jgi:hypothetical protein
MTTNRGVTGSWAKLMALYYFSPTTNGSPYLGGGIGYGVTAVSNATATYTGSGLQGTNLDAEQQATGLTAVNLTVSQVGNQPDVWERTIANIAQQDQAPGDRRPRGGVDIPVDGGALRRSPRWRRASCHFPRDKRSRLSHRHRKKFAADNRELFAVPPASIR